MLYVIASQSHMIAKYLCWSHFICSEYAPKFYISTRRVLMKCPSCTAAKVATPATKAMGTMDQNTVGTKRKSKRPVILLAFV